MRGIKLRLLEAADICDHSSSLMLAAASQRCAALSSALILEYMPFGMVVADVWVGEGICEA